MTYSRHTINTLSALKNNPEAPENSHTKVTVALEKEGKNGGVTYRLLDAGAE